MSFLELPLVTVVEEKVKKSCPRGRIAKCDIQDIVQTSAEMYLKGSLNLM